MPGIDDPTTTPGPSVGSAGDADMLAARFLLLADQDFAGYCPIYDRIARALATDPESLALLLGPTSVNRTPVLALAATHDLVLRAPDTELAASYRGERGVDPWPAFRALLHDRADEVRGLMVTRSIQTNEVGRSAALVPALASVALRRQAFSDPKAGGEVPLALFEVGPSAGLNLMLDRFAVRYVDRVGREIGRTGPPASGVTLVCELRGDRRPPLPAAPLEIARREGLDLNPIDVTDDDACRWLTACVWPGIPERPERLAAALAVTRREPPLLHVGDAAVDLGALVASIPDDCLPVVVATWALAYLDPAGRRAVASAIDAEGQRRDIALVTAEAPQVTPWVPAVDDDVRGAATDDAANTVTVLGLRQWQGGQVTTDALAVMHPHGTWLAWLAESER